MSDNALYDTAVRQIDRLEAEVERLRGIAAAASEMLAALEEARETIHQFLHSRWSEAEGPDDAWLGRIDAAIASARALGIKES